MKPLVSIIIPVYNSEELISETINSVLQQKYKNWEMIMVDDFSDDNSIEIIKEYQQKDERIKLIRLDNNQGVANARNIGLKYAKGKYIAFLDSDDIWISEKLEKQVIFMLDNNIEFSFTEYRHFYKFADELEKKINIPSIVDYRTLLRGNVIGCLTVMIDREKIPNIYMPKQRHEDYITWLAILKQGFKAYGLKEDLARYRVRGSSLSSNKKRSSLWTWCIYRNIEKLSLAESLYYFSWYTIRSIKKHYM